MEAKDRNLLIAVIFVLLLFLILFAVFFERMFTVGKAIYQLG